MAPVPEPRRWFVRRGTPTMIEGYGFVTHVLPRMLPALSFVALASLAWLVLLRSVGSWRWLLLAGIVGLVLAVWTTTSLFVRRLPTFSRRTTIVILVAYAVLPVAVPLDRSAR